MLWIAVLFVAGLFPAEAQDRPGTAEDYRQYHSLICKAEVAFYLGGNADSCLYYYNKAFEGFSFNYVHDLVNAAQIAYYSQRDFGPYLYKGLRFGLKSSHLKPIRLFRESGIVRELEAYERTAEYTAVRAQYLSSLNLDYLSWLYDFGIEEQIRKNQDGYEAYSLRFMIDLKSRIRRLGFPGNRIVGINCATIFAEAGRNEPDLSERVRPIPHLSAHYATEDELLSNNLILFPLHHRRCSFTELKEIMLEEIAKGNLHPREFGLLYDRQCECEIKSYTPIFDNCPRLIKEDGVFRIGNTLLSSTINQIKCSDEKVNSLRARYHIAPIEVDRQKRMYQQQHGFKLFWGFWDSL